MNLATSSHKGIGHAMTDMAVSYMTMLADVIEPIADTSLKISKSVGLPEPTAVKTPVLFRPIAEASLQNTKLALLCNPLTAMRAWHKVTSDATTAMTPEPLRSVMSTTLGTVRDLTFPDVSRAVEAIEDLEGVFAKTPDTLTFCGPIMPDSVREERQGERKKENRAERDNPSNVETLLSANPGTNIRAAAEIVRVWGGDHSHHEAFTIESVKRESKTAPIQQVSVGETDLTDFILFHHGEADDIENLDLEGLVVLGPPHSGHPPAFVQPMAVHLLQTGRPVLIPAFKHPADWKNEETIRDLDSHVAEFELAYKLAAELSGGRNFHAAAVCEPGSSMLAAASINRQLYGDNRFVPLSLTLVNSPIFPGAADTEISEMASSKSDAWLEKLRSSHNGKDMYEHQITAFIMKSLGRHMKGTAEIGNAIVQGDFEQATEKAGQYEALLHGMPLPWEFYQETFTRQFQNGELGNGEMTIRDIPVDPSVLDDMYLHTIGGENDDVTHEWQCGWAQVLCPGIVAQGLGVHSLVPGGHYAAWGDSRVARDTAIPKVAEVLERAEEAAGFEPKPFIVHGDVSERVEVDTYTPDTILAAKDSLRAEIPDEHLKIVYEAA